MSKIKIFGLGGLSESGKNSYVVEVDNDIFVFDAGIKFASGNLLGIDYIVPDFSYLVKNRKRIKGLFITHGHKENMGAVKDLVQDIPELKIYATKYTRFELIEDGVNSDNIILIKPHKKIPFGEVSIFPIAVSHSAPDSVMFVINTKDGAIAYTGDFIIDPSMSGAYDMDLGKIAYVGKQGVLCLLSESSFAEKDGHTSPNHRLVDFYSNVINHHDKRILFSVLPDHLYTIAEIFEAASNSHRKIVIMGKRLQNVVNFSKKEGYLDFNQEILGDLSNINDENAILLIMDDKTTPYANISKILNGYDKYVTLKNTDTIVFAEPRYDSTEKILVRLQNDLAMFGCDIETIPKDKEILHHASREDLMIMIKLLNPKFYMPVKGEYRYMVNNADIASTLKIPDSNILLKQNGDVVTFEDGKLIDNFARVKVDDVLIDGSSNDDVGDLVIKDREMLSENGIVLISATIDKRDKVLIVGPEVTTRGFIYVKDSQDMIKEIKHICEEIINSNITPKYVDCKPMIIAVVQEV